MFFYIFWTLDKRLLRIIDIRDFFFFNKDLMKAANYKNKNVGLKFLRI